MKPTPSLQRLWPLGQPTRRTKGSSLPDTAPHESVSRANRCSSSCVRIIHYKKQREPYESGALPEQVKSLGLSSDSAWVAIRCTAAMIRKLATDLNGSVSPWLDTEPCDYFGFALDLRRG